MKGGLSLYLGGDVGEGREVTRTASIRAPALLIALAGFGLLSVGDAIIKSVAGEWPGTALTTLRFAIGSVLIGLIVLVREGAPAFRVRRIGLHVARGIAWAVAALSFYLALFAMPLAQATTIEFLSPMLVGLIAAATLGERMTRSALIATMVAFAGVLIVLRPGGAGFDWSALLPLLAATGMATLIVLNRLAAGTASVLASQFYAALFCTPVVLAATIIGHWSGIEALRVTPLPGSVLLRAAAVACTASLAHTLVFTATVRAGASEVAPMVYVQLLVALALGAVFYDDRPDGWALVGAALVIGAGLFLWSRQRRRNLGGVPA